MTIFLTTMESRYSSHDNTLQCINRQLTGSRLIGLLYCGPCPWARMSCHVRHATWGKNLTESSRKNKFPPAITCRIFTRRISVYPFGCTLQEVSDLHAFDQHFDTYAAIGLGFLYLVIHADRFSRRHMILVNTRRVLPTFSRRCCGFLGRFDQRIFEMI